MSKTPMIRQVSILASLPYLIVLAGFVYVGTQLSSEYGVLWALALFLLLRFLLRKIPRYHRTGIRLVRQQQFAEAIPCFVRSFEFFEKQLWLDRYRSVLLLSPSSVSYREMALCNAGFCCSQIDEGANARKYYEQCLGLFPESMVAMSALKTLDAGKKEISSNTAEHK